MPRPHKGEKKNEYISRAIEYMREIEKLDQKHAVGKAYGMWKQSKKQGKRGR